MRKNNLLALIVVLASFALGLVFYPHLPNQVASHWGLNNEVNGHMDKFWGAFFAPLLMVGIYLVFLIVPKADPHKKNYKDFQKYFDNFIVLLEVFLLYIHLLTLLWNIGYQFSFNLALPPALGVLFFYIGVLLSHAKQNWFIGIRTPWTLSSEKVWDQTHVLGGKLFRIAGVVSFASIILPTVSIFFVIGFLVGISLFLFFYSYYLYHKS